MDECPRELQAWLVEKHTLAVPPADAACDYSLEPLDALFEPVLVSPAMTRRADLDEVLGLPRNGRVLAASASH
jgi:hypothetical protein